MAFVPRTFQTILTDMIAYVQAYTTINDFNVGSVVRTILEAAAMEDDEQYFQMVQLLDLFSITNASGENLDRRLAEFNLVRSQAKPAFGKVRFYDTNLVSDQVALDAVAGVNVVKIFDSSGFPTSYPYTIRIAENTIRAQDVSVIALDTVTHTFTLDGTTLLTSDIIVGDRVSLVTGAQAHVVNSGTTIKAPPTNSESAKTYTTTEPAFIAAGNFYSNEVIIKASASGTTSNVAAERITQFQGAKPFQGAGVVNLSTVEGGTNRELDQDFRARALEQLQALSRGTILALRAASVGVEDVVTGQRVVSANVYEDFVNDEVIVYIDDGTGLDPDVAALAQSSLASAAGIGDFTLTLNDGSDFPSFGTVLIGTDELVSYSGKSTINTLALETALTAAHSSGAIVRFVDVVSESSEAGQRHFKVQNFPVVRSTDRVFTKAPAASVWTELSRTSEFLLNKGTGDLLIVDTGGLGVGTAVVAYYNYYTNLVAEAQKVLEGDPNDSTSYPGVKAAGIILSVEAPVIKRIIINVTISAEATYVESELAPLVQQAIETYISSLGIGDDVIRSRIIDSAHDVSGVRSVTVSLPTSDVIVLENELPVPYDISDNSLVTVL